MFLFLDFTERLHLVMLSLLIRELVLPPVSLFLVLVFAAAVHRLRPRLSKWLVATSASLLLLISMGIVALPLVKSTERIPPVQLDEAARFDAELIVVLGAGVVMNAEEFDGQTVPSEFSLERLAYAFWLSEELDLPIMTSGGYGERAEDSEAAAMKRTLELWGCSEVWAEGRSRNTRQNAKFVGERMKRLNFERALLVTSASHMPRALDSFKTTGLKFKGCPTGFEKIGPRERGLMRFVPSARQLQLSSESFRAMLADLWYLMTD